MVASFFAIKTSKEAFIEESLIPSEPDFLGNQRARRWNDSFPLLSGRRSLALALATRILRMAESRSLPMSQTQCRAHLSKVSNRLVPSGLSVVS
jgi:hypothetical protein